MNMLHTLLFTGSVLVLLCACGNPSTEPAPPAAKTVPNTTKQEVQQPVELPAQPAMDSSSPDEEVTVIRDQSDGLPLLTASVTRPDVSGSVEGSAKKVIDRYYDELYRQEEEWWTNGLVDFAKENKKAAADYGGDFLPFTVIESSEIVYDGPAFLSIRRHLESYTGGAHGSHVVSCENFRKSDGSLVKLSDIFRDDSYKEILLKKIEEHVLNNNMESNLYEDWENMLNSSFDEDRFSIDKESLTIIYQEYDIAPYAAGAQYFSISYADLSNELNEPFLRDIYGGKE